jgi:hypothetical protein
MSERICANCKVPVVRHIGQSGRHCDWPSKDSDSDSNHSLMSENDGSEQNKEILGRLDKLTLAVEGLIARELNRVKTH